MGYAYELPSTKHPHGIGKHPITEDYYAPFSAYYDDMPIFTDAFGSQVLVDNIATYFADGTPLESGARVDNARLKTSSISARFAGIGP